MFFSTWRQCLSHYIRTVGPKNRQRTPRPAFIWRPGLEHLEDRISPATDITVVLGAAGTGNLDHFLSATNGTITTADDPGDTAATLSVGALTAIGSAVAISIAADNSITFNDLVSLNLPNAAGVTAAFSTTSGPISFDSLTDTLYTAGGALSFSAGTNLAVCDLNTNGGDVSLIAGTAAAGNLVLGNILTNGAGNLTFQANGSITQAGTPTATSGKAMTATATGDIGTSAADPLLVQISTLSADVTGTGSINVTNTGAGGSLTVTRTVTANGAVNLTVNGGSLTVNGTTSPVISAEGNTVTLIAADGIISSTGSGITDVAAGSLAIITNSGGVGSGNLVTTSAGAGMDPLKTSVNTFAASVALQSGGVFVANAGPLTIGVVGTVNGITEFETNTTFNLITFPQPINVSAISPLTVANNVTGPADVDLTAMESIPAPAGPNDSLTVNGGVTVESTGGNVTLSAGNNLILQTGSTIKSDGGQVTLKLGNNNINAISDGAIAGTVDQGGTGSPLVQDGATNDNLLVDFNAGANLLQGLTYKGGAGTANQLTISDAGGASAHTYKASGTAITRDGATTIDIAGVQQVSINGGNASDTFDVTPAATTAFTINGGGHPTVPATPGDSLTVNALGTSVTIQNNTITSGNLAPVAFANIETLTINNKTGPYNFPGLSANQRFVQALYLDGLKRLGSVAELNGWVGNLPGMGQGGVSEGILRSREALTRVVDSMYLQYLGRPADLLGETGFTNDMLAGATEEEVSADILSSPEFQAHATLMVRGVDAYSNYVAALYLVLLNRTGSAAEIAGHAALVPTQGFAGLANSILASSEYRSDAVRTLYGDPTLTPLPAQPYLIDLLFRQAAPTAAEVNAWVTSGPDVLSIEEAFAGTGEFFLDG